MLFNSGSFVISSSISAYKVGGPPASCGTGPVAKLLYCRRATCSVHTYTTICAVLNSIPRRLFPRTVHIKKERESNPLQVLQLDVESRDYSCMLSTMMFNLFVLVLHRANNDRYSYGLHQININVHLLSL